MLSKDLSNYIGEEYTINGITGKLIRIKKPNILVLFDGKENHEVVFVELKQVCGSCKQELSSDEFDKHKDGTPYKTCKKCLDNQKKYYQKQSKAQKKSKVDRHKEIVLELNQLYADKNQDYGDSFGKTYDLLGLISAVTRITDKYNRLVSLSTQKNQKVKDESLEDTLRDLANYCIMTIMELEEKT